MRRLLPILIALLVLAIGARFRFGLKIERSPAITPLEAIAEVKQAFLDSHRPEMELDLSSLRQNGLGKELVAPESALPHTQEFPVQAIVSLYRYAEECQGAPSEKIIPTELRKTFTWHRFLCGDLSRLPAKFFETAPYMHPSGESFVRLAERSGKREFRDGPWRETHSSYLHVSELGLGFSRARLKHVLAESPVFTDANLVFIRQKKEGRFGASHYVTFQRGAWSNFLNQKSELETVTWRPAEWCLLKEGNLCWRERKVDVSPYRRIAVGLLFATLVVLALVLLWLVVQKLRMRRKERQARVFALQTLTHELRTPATTLALGVESLKRHFDALPATAQADLLRMGDEIQRLNRVLRASTQYVKSHRDPRHIQFQAAPVDSVNEFFQNVLEPYLDRISFAPLDRDTGARLDRYWVGLCVKNLVDNALTHGKPPVAVRLRAAKPGVVVEVSDGGNLAKFDLEDLMGGLTRQGSSPGLGIGLSIVARVAALMKGKLTLSPSPTTFSLWLRSPA